LDSLNRQFAVEEFKFEELEGGGGEETETAANFAKSISSNVSALCDGVGVRRNKIQDEMK